VHVESINAKDISVPEEISWETANMRCHAEGGYLASVITSAERAAASKLLFQYHDWRVYVGMVAVEPRFVHYL
jgi:hypothetical protein